MSFMPRKARVEFPGAVYHVLDRGDRREAIFRDDADRVRFLETLGEVCARTGWRVHAFVLMSNHYHLMIETPEDNLVAGMSYRFAPPASAPALSRKASAQTTWTIRFNRRHRLSGHLFQGRYRLMKVLTRAATAEQMVRLGSDRVPIVSLPPGRWPSSDSKTQIGTRLKVRLV